MVSNDPKDANVDLLKLLKTTKRTSSKEVKTMKVWTNGKGICAYKGQDKHNAIKRKEGEGYKVMIAKLYDVESEEK